MQTAYATFNYSTRGDALGATGANLLANGVSLPSTPTAAGFSGPYAVTWDPLAGAMLSTSWNAGDSTGDSMTTSMKIGYDQVGRMLTSGSDTGFSPSITSNAPSWDSSDSVTRTYDDENHTISSSFVDSLTQSVSGLALYQWGPAGHPVLIGSASSSTTTVPSPSAVQYDTLHWDGDQLVFTSKASGTVDDIKIGTEGDITPLDPGFTGLTFFDRGPDGSVMYCHNYTGATGNGTVDPYSIATPCVGGAIQSVSGYTFYMPSSFLWQSNPDVTKKGLGGVPAWTYRALGVGQGMLLGMLRTDGMTDGINTIQGVRTYDGNSGQWTSPDALAGSDTDPASQKAYLWNGGNPLANGDPSGNYIINGHYNWCLADNSCNSIFGDSASDISGIWAAIATPDAVVGAEYKTIAVVSAKAKPKPRAPDFVTFTPLGAYASIPPLWIGPGAAFTFTLDHCGRLYVGGSVGVGTIGDNVSLMAGWGMPADSPSSAPSPSQLSAIISGTSSYGSSGAGVVVGVTNNSNGSSANLGFGYKGAGAGWSLTSSGVQVPRIHWGGKC